LQADGTGIEFLQIQDHFQMNMDEYNCVASDGILRIVGSYDRKKHDKESADCRLSITALVVGNAAGTTGPVTVLGKGKKVSYPYNDMKYLEDDLHLPTGSQVLPTPSAFMTDEAFDALVPAWSAGIRQMEVVRDHPEWWIRSECKPFD
jgi:hypothetical protein